MRTLIILASLFACLGVIAAVLVGISFSESHRKQHQFLNLLYEEQTQLLTFTVILWVMAYGAKLWKDLLSSKPQLESIHLYSGQLSQKVTRHGVKAGVGGSRYRGRSRSQSVSCCRREGFCGETFSRSRRQLSKGQ